MATTKRSAYQTAGVVLTRDQMRRLDALRAARSTPVRIVSRSELLREIVEIGLNDISPAPNSILTTSTDERDETAA